MKNLLTVLTAIVLISSGTFAQTFTRMQGWGLDLESVAWLDAEEGISVGEKLIIRTSDGGITWQEVLQKIEGRLFDVVYLEVGKAVAVGENGVIYLTLDGGISWQQKASGTQNDLLSIAKSPSSKLVAVGENGEILSSSDAGETWEKISSGTSLSLNDITFASENVAYIVAEGGTIMKSLDQGDSWVISNLTQNTALYGIAFSNELIGYAVGEGGLFVKTIDGGITWSVLKVPTTNTLRKIAINQLNVRVVAAVGDAATVVRTANSGTSFSKPNLGATNKRNIKGISFKPSSNLASSVGQDGYLINSTNSGSSWSQKLGGIRNNFTGTDFKNLNAGLIAGENGSLYLTTNGASTLTHRPLPEAIPIQAIDFWTTAFGYTGSADGKVYRTSNTGTAWTPIFTSAPRNISGFHLFSTKSLYITGSQGYISRSADSGDTWDETVQSNTDENLRDLLFFDDQFGFAIGENGHISRTSGGSVWETQQKITENNLNALAKIDTARAFVVGDGGVILKTEDKARTWEKVESGTTKKLYSIDFFGDSYGFIAGEEGLVLATSDGGETWKLFDSGTTRDLNAVSAGTAQKAYFTGADGTILSYICAAPVADLGEIVGDSEACPVSATYSVSGQPDSNSDIVWRVDGGEIVSGQGSSEIEVRWTKSGRNAVLVSRTNFCGSGETSALEVNVAVPPISNAPISGDGAVCEGISYTYSLPEVKGVTYIWTVSGGELIQGQETHEVEIRWNQKGDQLLSVTQENLCGRAEPIRKNISVNSTPDSAMEISGEAKVGPGEQIYEIDALPGLNYRWAISGLGGRVISGQGTGSILVSWMEEGDFEVSVEAQNECGYSIKSTLPVNVNLITALEPPVDGSLKIYPNPSQGSLTISSEGLDFWSSVQIFNQLGQEIMQLPISAGQAEVFVQGLPKGLILIRIQGKSGGFSRKILVR